MKKALMLGTMVLATTAAHARNGGIGSSYAFTGFCDGLGSLVLKDDVVTGEHVYENCGSGYTDTYVGGVGGKIKSLGPGVWYPLIGSEYDTPLALIYYTNFKSLEWFLYGTSTYYELPFEEFNDGTLTAGYAPRGGGKTLASTVHAGMLRAGLIGK